MRAGRSTHIRLHQLIKVLILSTRSSLCVCGGGGDVWMCAGGEGVCGVCVCV